MFSAFNFRNVVIGSVAVSSYRDYCNRNGVPYYMTSRIAPTVSSLQHNDRSNGLLYLMVTLSFMLFMLLMMPSLIEPPVLYIGVIFSLLSLIFIIGFTNSYLKNKQSNRSESSVEVDRRLSNDSNNFSNLLTCDASDGQHNNNNNESQLTVSSTDLPPKYELPPSYSQTTYSINI